MLTNCEDIGMITILKIATARLTSADFASLKAAEAQIVARGRSALLVDLSAVRRITRSGLAALVEFQSEAPRQLAIGFFGAGRAVQREFERCALATLLTLFATRQQALDAAPFRARRLAGVKAVLLVAGAGSRMAPMSRDTPKPLLDVLGRTVLDRLMGHLMRFGIRDFVLNPGHLAPQFHRQVRSSALRSVQFLNEGAFAGATWQAAPLGSASTLLKLQHQCAAFPEDFLVFCGDALTDVDLSDLMTVHRESGAEVTLVTQTVPADQVHKYGIIDADPRGRVRRFVEKPAPPAASPRLASTGIYVMHPRALARLNGGAGLDIARDLLPAILAAGGHVQVYDTPCTWVDMGCGRDYFAALSRGLRGLIPDVTPVGQEVRRHVWLAPGAHLSPRAVVVGPCYLGPDATVDAGAKLEGPCVIGAGARISSRTLIRRSVIWPQTTVAPGSWVDDMIAAPGWAVEHRLADGRPGRFAPLEGLSQTVDRDAATPLVQLAGGHRA